MLEELDMEAVERANGPVVAGLLKELLAIEKAIGPAGDPDLSYDPFRRRDLVSTHSRLAAQLEELVMKNAAEKAAVAEAYGRQLAGAN